MFNSLYSEKLSLYYELRSKVLSKSARMHELCYLKRFDQYLFDHISSTSLVFVLTVVHFMGHLGWFSFRYSCQ